MRAMIAVALLAVCASPAGLRAEIYKCQDADGILTYSQTPCSTEAPVTVQSSGSSTSAADCSYANKFAVATARLMRNGAASDEVFDRYGGLGALSKGSIGVINYVYSFRTNDDVTAERIAGLAQAKCKARGFGDVSCETLPLSFTENLGGCDAEEDEEVSQPPSANEPTTALHDQTASPSALNSGRESQRTTSTSNDEHTEQCKKRYRDEIDAIDAQMRSGYSSQQGEIYREQLRSLTERLRAC